MGVALALVLAIGYAAVGSPGARDELRWRAPPGCPTHDDVAALIAVEARGLSEAQRAAIVTHAEVSAAGRGRWQVFITVRQPGNELQRDLELDSCDAAAEAVALVFGLAVTQAETQRDAPVSDEAEPAEEGLPLPPSPRPALPRPKPTVTALPPASRRGPAITTEETAPPGVAVHAGAGANVGNLGVAGGYVLAGVSLVWPRLRIALRADHAIRQRFRLQSMDTPGGNLSSTTGGLELGPAFQAGPVWLIPLATVRAGAIRARGVGGARAHTRWVPWVTAGVGLSAVWMLSRRIGVRLGAELSVPLVRHTFVFDELFIAATRRVGGLFWAGPEIRLSGLDSKR